VDETDAILGVIQIPQMDDPLVANSLGKPHKLEERVVVRCECRARVEKMTYGELNPDAQLMAGVLKRIRSGSFFRLCS
jgi:hypothetical protein